MMKLSAEQIAAFDEKGYVVLPELFSSREVEKMRGALSDVLKLDRPELVRERHNESVRLVYGADRFNTTFDRLVHHPRWIGPACQLLKSDVYLHQLRINPKAPFDGGGWWWHQDYGTWRFEDGMPTARALMIGVFLNDMNDCNGPLMVIPGSHRYGHIDDSQPDRDKSGYTVMDLSQGIIAKLVEEGGVEALTGPAGTVLFMHCNLVHGSTGNITPSTRTIAYLNVNSTENAITKFGRAEYFANRDFSPLQAYGDDCLLQQAAA
jgi:ectoine hydroxylase